MSTTTTLQARAFLVDWTPSLSAVEIYTLANDATPPTITATVSPAANAAGWHHSDVTVTFTCDDPESGITSCPSPVTVTTEGAGQVVEGMATNGAGLTATASVTINLDKTPPVVTLTAPENGATVVGPTTAAAGTATDELSGLASVRCNGQAASLDGDAVACAAPVHPGRNAIVVHATDVAGNSGSAGATVRVAGSGLAVFPSRFTLLQGDSRTLVATDSAANPVEGVTWTTSDPSVAAFSAEDPSSLEAVGPGDATVTATLDSLTATAQVTVVAGATLPMGTVVWAADPFPGVVAGRVVYTHRTDPTVPDLYSIEQDEASWRTQYRGFTGSGDATQLEIPPLSDEEYVAQTMGDTSGGLVVRSDTGVARFAGPAGVLPWRYDAPDSVGDMAQGPDGTIYLVEWRSTGGPEVVVLDGATGQVRQRIGGLPRSTSVIWNWDCEPNRTVSSDSPAHLGPLSVGPQGTAYLELATTEQVYDYLPCGAGGGESTYRLHLLSVSPDGTSTLQLLRSETSDTDSSPVVTPQQALPDGNGGVLASWAIDYPDHGETLGVYVRGGGATQYTLPGTAWTEGTEADHYAVDLVGDDGVAYTGGDSQLAFEMATGVTQWTVPGSGSPFVALSDGGVGTREGEAVTERDAEGSPVQSWSLGIDDARHVGGGRWLGRDGSATELVVAGSVALASYEYDTGPGSPQMSKGPRGRFGNERLAAFEALRTVYDYARITGWEWGGMICKVSEGQYSHSKPRTDQDAGSVYSDQSPCPANTTTVGDYHAHTIGEGPSGMQVRTDRDDIYRANQHTGLTFYLISPSPRVYMYKGPNAECNVMVWNSTTGKWEPWQP